MMHDEEAKTLMNNVKNKLVNYPMIDKYLGKLVKQRALLAHADRGIIIAHLLDDNAETKQALDHLEVVLKAGDSDCQNFKQIFQIHLPKEAIKNKLGDIWDSPADARLLDILSEVEAFEFLSKRGFNQISYIRPTPQRATVDFTALRGKSQYAIEVTRLNLPQSENKKAKPSIQTSDLKKTGFTLEIYDSRQTLPAFEKTLVASIRQKYSQVKEFCDAQNNPQIKAILVISWGDRFFVSPFARRESRAQPDTIRSATQSAWKIVQNDKSRPTYLSHLVVLQRSIRCAECPPLPREKYVKTI